MCGGLKQSMGFVSLKFSPAIAQSRCPLLATKVKCYVGSPDEVIVTCTNPTRRQSAGTTSIATITSAVTSDLSVIASRARSDTTYQAQFGSQPIVDYTEPMSVESSSSGMANPGYAAGPIFLILLIVLSAGAVLGPKLRPHWFTFDLMKTGAVIAMVTATIAMGSTQWLRQTTKMFESLGPDEWACQCSDLHVLCKGNALHLAGATMFFFAVYSVVFAASLVSCTLTLMNTLGTPLNQFRALAFASTPLGAASTAIASGFFAILEIGLFGGLNAKCNLASPGAQGLAVGMLAMMGGGGGGGAGTATAQALSQSKLGASWVLTLLCALTQFAVAAFLLVAWKKPDLGVYPPTEDAAAAYAEQAGRPVKHIDGEGEAATDVNAIPVISAWPRKLLYIIVMLVLWNIELWFGFFALVNEKWAEAPGSRVTPFHACSCDSIPKTGTSHGLMVAIGVFFGFYYFAIIVTTLVWVAIPTILALMEMIHKPAFDKVNEKYQLVHDKINPHRKLVLLVRTGFCVSTMFLAILLISIMPMISTSATNTKTMVPAEGYSCTSSLRSRSCWRWSSSAGPCSCTCRPTTRRSMPKMATTTLLWLGRSRMAAPNPRRRSSSSGSTTTRNGPRKSRI
jgi:hypothetical protein